MSGTRNTPPPPAQGLVVPVDVVAFCVSESDAVQGTPSFSGATIDYGQFNQGNPDAYVGASATRSFIDPPAHPLEAGVHLHWALPDALTKGRVDENTSAPSFPAVPNRWLVTRFAINGGTATPMSWIVESDGLAAMLPSGTYAPVIPVKKAGTSDPGFSFLGLRAPLANYQGRLGEQAYAEASGGTPFTAVANGMPTFAAYYPESRSSFGFVDTLADLGGPAQLMYVVTGWFDQPANDPAQICAAPPDPAFGKPAPTLSGSYGWTAGGGGSGQGDTPQPAYTLYSGTVQAIAWDPNRQYVPAPENQPTITADAALGNTPSEALAAYFRNLLHPSTPYFEKILTAFQQGQWPTFTQPTPDRLAAIDEALHSSQFQRIDSNLIWTIYQADPDGSPHEAIDLPQGIADALNQANVARAQLAAVNEHVETFMWQAFSDWYRYFQVQDPAEKTVVFNHFAETLMPIWQGPNGNDGLQAEQSTAAAAASAGDQALQAVIKQRPDLSLRGVPGARYWQPTDPALMLVGDGLALSPRYGGDEEHSGTGQLVCRTTDEIVSAVTVNAINRTASDYADAARLTSNSLPHLADCEALLAEALLLDANLAASWSGIAAATLTADLEALLTGAPQKSWTIATGAAPSPVEVNWWEGANPWIPLFIAWTADFVPLQPTIVNQVTLEDYDPAFFTANYTIDPDTGSFLSYTPSGPHGIVIDPAAQTYTPTYQGSAILSDKTVENLEGQITQYLQTHSDTTLETILSDLQAGQFVVQPLSGFTEAMINRVLQAQMALVVPPGADSRAQLLTQTVAGIVGGVYNVGPSFNTAYNPIRAGFFKLSGQCVDAFGQRRTVKIGNFYLAESMTTVAGGNTEPGIAYAAPRIAQASRLTFDWMSAGVQTIEEMTAHPATSPVCGWIMPNHLTGGFFLYDGDGATLGALQLNRAQPPVPVWQGAPGDDADIDEPIDQALADANPLLRAVALSLHGASADYFKAFYAAVDTVHATVNPQNLSLESGLAVLAGRPVALAQAAIRLDLRGRPMFNQNSNACLGENAWTDTENGLSVVQFPVLLGDADKLDDGLIGFFRQAESGDGFDLSTFFSAGAAAGSSGGVVRPDASTLLLTLTPKADDPDPPPAGSETVRVLMLIDPRAPVHAVTGILPTQELAIPSDVASAALSSLEIYFLAAPVLKPASVLALPVPAASGFDVSFIEQYLANGAPEWVTIPDITPTSEKAVWHYTPQSLTEGWLRINQLRLGFALTNQAGKAVVTGGATQNLTLTLTNDKPNQVTFTPGVLAAEGTPPKGSIFYLHFGELVADDDVAKIGLAAPGWSFASQQDAVYGAYWAATPTEDAVALAPGASLAIAVTNLKVTTSLAQAKLCFDYYAVDGAANGVFTDMVVVSQSS
jgi:hypothetical protein